MLSGDFELVDSGDEESKDTSFDDLKENTGTSSESDMHSNNSQSDTSAESKDGRGKSEDKSTADVTSGEKEGKTKDAVESLPEPPAVIHMPAKKNASSSKSNRKPIAQIAEPTPQSDEIVGEGKPNPEVSTKEVRTATMSPASTVEHASSANANAAVGSESTLPSLPHVAQEKLGTWAAATPVVFARGMDVATSAVEKSVDAVTPLVQSAEDLTQQYVLPLGDAIAHSETATKAIDGAVDAIERGFHRAQGPVSKLEGLVLSYVANPLDEKLGKFSTWADAQTPSSFVSGVASWTRDSATSTASYLYSKGTSAYQSARTRWGAAGEAGKDAAASAATTPVEAPSEDGGAVLVASNPCTEENAASVGAAGSQAGAGVAAAVQQLAANAAGAFPAVEDCTSQL